MFPCTYIGEGFMICDLGMFGCEDSGWCDLRHWYGICITFIRSDIHQDVKDAEDAVNIYLLADTHVASLSMRHLPEF